MKLFSSHNFGFMYTSKNLLHVYSSYFFIIVIYSHACVIKWSGTPAFFAIVRPCSFMWPFCIPSMAKALKAAKFWAKPTHTKIWLSYCAFGFPIISKVDLYKGFLLITPPTDPTAMGSSKDPLKYYSPFFCTIS